jgi:GNAT superfamily N-acetyltransferase
MGYVSALRRHHLWTGDDVLALYGLYVREQFRDAGAGRALMLELARYAFPQQLTITWKFSPTTTTHSGSIPASELVCVRRSSHNGMGTSTRRNSALDRACLVHQFGDLKELGSCQRDGRRPC